jgi:hypothetical protein
MAGEQNLGTGSVKIVPDLTTFREELAAGVGPSLASVGAQGAAFPIAAGAVGAAEAFPKVAAGAAAAEKEIAQAGVASGALAGEVRGASTAMSGFVKVIAASAVAKFFFSATQDASNLTEQLTKTNRVFRESADSVLSFSKGAESIGLSDAAALKATSTFGNLFTSIGLTRSSAATMSTTLTALAADFASFNNISVAEVVERLQSGIVGQTRALRPLGIAIDATRVKQQALADGFVEINGQLDASAKIQATYELILKESGNAQGDFARTSGNLANQQRVLKAEFADAKIEIGKGLTPVMLELVKALRDGLPSFVSAGLAIGSVLGTAVKTVIPLIGPLTLGLEAVGKIVSFIPAPLLAAAGAYIVLAKAMVAINAAKESQIVLTGIKTAMASLLPEAAAIGTVIPIAGAALAAGAVVYSLWKDKKAAATAEVKKFTDAITSDTKALLANNAAAATKTSDTLFDKLKGNEKLVFLLNEAGVTIPAVTTALRGVNDAGNAGGDSLKTLFQRAEDAANTSARAIHATSGEFVDTAGKVIPVANTMGETIAKVFDQSNNPKAKDLANQFRLVAAAGGATDDQILTLLDTLNTDVVPGFAKSEAQLKLMGGATLVAADATKKLKDSLNLGPAFDDATAKLRPFEQALKDINSAAKDALDALTILGGGKLNINDVQAKVTQDIAKLKFDKLNGHITFDIGTEIGAKNFDQLSSLAQQTTKTYEAGIKANLSQGQIGALLGNDISRELDGALKAGGKSAVEELRRVLGLEFPGIFALDGSINTQGFLADVGKITTQPTLGTIQQSDRDAQTLAATTLAKLQATLAGASSIGAGVIPDERNAVAQSAIDTLTKNRDILLSVNNIPAEAKKALAAIGINVDNPGDIAQAANGTIKVTVAGGNTYVLNGVNYKDVQSVLDATQADALSGSTGG